MQTVSLAKIGMAALYSHMSPFDLALVLALKLGKLASFTISIALRKTMAWTKNGTFSIYYSIFYLVESHSLSNYALFSEKLTFLAPWELNVSFLGKICVYAK